LFEEYFLVYKTLLPIYLKLILKVFKGVLTLYEYNMYSAMKCMNEIS